MRITGVHRVHHPPYTPPVPNLTSLVPPLSHNLHPMSLPQHAQNYHCPSTPDNPF
ncbi:hypothetical protein A2U01_0076760 [Trifolium medium]|uniref:Uncharacterized protein n=1 Tax=Trifolium medium TaxID=97028 RepID=A0A392T389_9FABA|nr:hypothetical protein [Trifolium medium]